MGATLGKPDQLRSGATRRCRHHWLIDVPNGARSRGICKRCQTVRNFYNAIDDVPESDQAKAPFLRTAGRGLNPVGRT